MPSFPGSSFFFDTEFLKQRTFLPSHYNIPLFICSKFSCQKNYNHRNKLFLRKQLRRYIKIYNQRARICVKNYSKCLDSSAKQHKKLQRRSRKSNAFLTPAPNQYKVKEITDISKKPTGMLGPYSCFTGVRDETSYYGHMMEVVGYKPNSTNFYFDLPSEMNRLNEPRNHFVMKIRKGSRDKHRTYMRSMLADLSLCPKDPKFPGPDKYFPQNFVIRKRALKPIRTVKSFIFHPGSYIPESDRFYSQKPSLPGPGRYNPQAIACPCKCGSEYSGNFATNAEREKWIYSPLYSKPEYAIQCTCEAPNLRNIPGKGFASVFKSATKRLLEKPKIDQKHMNKKNTRNADKFPMFLDTQYVHLISQPKRQLLSIRIDNKPSQVAEVRFNTTAEILPRQKMRTNKTVAFMSSCPRFEGDGGKATFLANKKSTKKSVSTIHLKKVNVPCFTSTEGTERLSKLPMRYQRFKLQASCNDKLANLFPHLPKPKILLNQIRFNVT